MFRNDDLISYLYRLHGSDWYYLARAKRKRSWKQKEFDTDLCEIVWSTANAPGEAAANLVSAVRKNCAQHATKLCVHYKNQSQRIYRMIKKLRSESLMPPTE